MTNMKRLHISMMVLLLSVTVWGQQYLGTPGLIHVPTADMDTVGVARVGAHYVPKVMIPDRMTFDKEKFNSLTNYLSITPFRWVELGYGYTLWKVHRNMDRNQKGGFYSKDRYFTVRLQPISEDKWWPSVVLGSNDIWGSSDEGKSGSNFYRNYYLAASKHIDWAGNRIGGHLAYRYWRRDYNHKWNGVVGGITFQPSFYRPLRVMAEWDGNEANVGIDCRVAKYFLLQCGLMDMKYFNGGLSLYINLL